VGPWQEHPVPALWRQLAALAIAPADRDSVGTADSGGHHKQRPMTAGAGSAAQPISAKTAIVETLYEY